MRKDRILITKEFIPYSFKILLADELFTLTIHYNDKRDFFTVGLEKDGETICQAEPIVYGYPLFRDVYEAGKYPCIDIIPIDESGERNTVTFENLNATVFLTVDNYSEDEETILERSTL